MVFLRNQVRRIDVPYLVVIYNLNPATSYISNNINLCALRDHLYDGGIHIRLRSQIDKRFNNTRLCKDWRHCNQAGNQCDD